jgi:hypothetical protein
VLGVGLGGGPQKEEQIQTLIPLPLTPSHQGRGDFETITY